MTISHVTCVCGARFTADSIPAVWQLFDHHIDAEHGPRWPQSVRGHLDYRPRSGGRRNRPAPITDQGGR